MSINKEKILIWGTGNICKEVLHNGISGEITGFIETKKQKDYFRGLPVYGITEIPEDYDYIIVASTFANDIYCTCIENKIDLDKMIFLYSVKKRVGQDDLPVIREILGEVNYANFCFENGMYKNTFFEKDLQKYNSLNHRESFRINKNHLWPIVNEKYKNAGVMGNYFWQDLWAARLVHKSGIKSHFDIGSRIDGFIAHLLSMEIEVTLIDIREFPSEVEGLHTIVDDATLLNNVADESIESMSALCSLEHFGLGRYGDSIDPEACFKCFAEIQKKIKKGGRLYLSVPVGKERVEFNAHRVFYPSTIIENFFDMELVEFSCTAEGKIEYNVNIHKYDNDNHNGEFRYGLFHFLKNKEKYI